MCRYRARFVWNSEIKRSLYMFGRCPLLYGGARVPPGQPQSGVLPAAGCDYTELCRISPGQPEKSTGIVPVRCFPHDKSDGARLLR